MYSRDQSGFFKNSTSRTFNCSLFLRCLRFLSRPSMLSSLAFLSSWDTHSLRSSNSSFHVLISKATFSVNFTADSAGLSLKTGLGTELTFVLWYTYELSKSFRSPPLPEEEQPSKLLENSSSTGSSRF